MIDINATTEMVNRLAALKKETADLLQDPLFDSISYIKFKDLQEKLAVGPWGRIETVFFGDDLKNVRATHRERRYQYLPQGFFEAPTFTPPDHSVFVVTNNDIGPSLRNYVKYKRRQRAP